jgi:hypothetical protein
MTSSDHRVLEVDGMRTVVPASDYPWIMEWDWEVDSSMEITRLSQEGRVNLYHEILKRHTDDELFYVLNTRQVHAVFGNTVEFQTLLAGWAELLEARSTPGYKPPNPLEVVSVGLTSALYYLFEHLSTGIEYSYTPDTEGGGSGALFRRRMRRPPKLRNLGDFLDLCCGEWGEDEDGEYPLTYGDILGFAADEFLTFIVQRDNGSEVSVEDVEDAFSGDYTLEALLEDAIEVVAQYSLLGVYLK